MGAAAEEKEKTGGEPLVGGCGGEMEKWEGAEGERERGRRRRRRRRERGRKVNGCEVEACWRVLLATERVENM